MFNITNRSSSAELLKPRKITTYTVWKDLLSLKPAPYYALRSSAQSLLFVPKVNCSTLGDRAFAHAAPVLWNSLPLTIRTSSSPAIFKKQLKTFFYCYFCHIYNFQFSYLMHYNCINIHVIQSIQFDCKVF